MSTGFDPTNLGGWLGITPEQQILQASIPPLSQAGPDLYRVVDPEKPVLLYKAMKDLIGDYIAYPAQEIGDCVGVSFAHAVDFQQCIEIALGEVGTEFQECDSEFIYAASREVGNMLRIGDGSYGAAAVKAATQVGLVSRPMLGTDGKYSGSRAKQWGRSGPPQKYKDLAKDFKLGSFAQINTSDDALAALTNGHIIQVCSNYGFTMQRDQTGSCSPRGTWNHAMMISAYRPDNGRQFLIHQSWGPNTPSGPTTMDQPNYSFWAPWATVNKMLAQGDSNALNGAPTFKKREIPSTWTILDMA